MFSIGRSNIIILQFSNFIDACLLKNTSIHSVYKDKPIVPLPLNHALITENQSQVLRLIKPTIQKILNILATVSKTKPRNYTEFENNC